MQECVKLDRSQAIFYFHHVRILKVKIKTIKVLGLSRVEIEVAKRHPHRAKEAERHGRIKIVLYDGICKKRFRKKKAGYSIFSRIDDEQFGALHKVNQNHKPEKANFQEGEIDFFSMINTVQKTSESILQIAIHCMAYSIDNIDYNLTKSSINFAIRKTMLLKYQR